VEIAHAFLAYQQIAKLAVLTGLYAQHAQQIMGFRQLMGVARFV
jgi:hypothetical protein